MLPDSPEPKLSDDISPTIRTRLRERSKVLFGNVDRLEVAVAIARSEDGVVNATDLSWDLRIANNRVRAQLVTMASLGLLTPVPLDSRKNWYQRSESSFWQTCLDLHEAWST
jgi:hypothetical protein